MKRLKVYEDTEKATFDRERFGLYTVLNLAFRYYLEEHNSLSGDKIYESVKELVKESSVGNDFSNTTWLESVLKTQAGSTYEDIGTFMGARGLGDTPTARR